MKILLNKLLPYITEENRFGFRSWKELPSNILTTARFLEDKGLKLDVKVQEVFKKDDFNDVDIIVSWVSVADGLYEGLDYLRVAKKLGLKTVLILFDDWDGFSKEILEDYSFVDFAIRRWDIEHNLLNVINKIKGMKYDSYGFVFREKYKVIDLGEKIYNHNSLSHLKSSRKWIQHLDVNNFDVFTLRLSSGCPFKCNFCHLGKRNSRYRDVEVIIDELSTFPKNSSVKLLSADLLANKEWVTKFAEEIIRKKIKIKWNTDSRFNWFEDVQFLKLVEKSGCEQLDVGLESFSNKILKSIKKAYNRDYVINQINNLNKTNIRLGLNMMIGNKYEDTESIEQTCNTIQNINKKNINLLGVQYLRPLPGTEIYKELLEENKIEKYSYKNFFTSRYEPIFLPDKLSYSEIIKGKASIENSF